jgi:hypothetical protein
MYIDEHESREAFKRIYKAVDDNPDLFFSDDLEKASRIGDEKKFLIISDSVKKEF